MHFFHRGGSSSSKLFLLCFPPTPSLLPSRRDLFLLFSSWRQREQRDTAETPQRLYYHAENIGCLWFPLTLNDYFNETNTFLSCKRSGKHDEEEKRKSVPTKKQWCMLGMFAHGNEMHTMVGFVKTKGGYGILAASGRRDCEGLRFLKVGFR
ncbi:unnamed protein product [Lathyrus sativus]|nr:unnamed protein product [Lathyrus sativus]